MLSLLRLRILRFVQGQIYSSKSERIGFLKLVFMLVIMGYIGIVLVGCFAFGYNILAEPLHAMGLDWLYFALMGLISFALCLLGSVFAFEYEVYEAKDYEFLMSMPIRNISLLMSRIVVLLVFNYLCELIVMIPALYEYIQIVNMSLMQIISFVCVFVFLPFIVQVIASVIAWFIVILKKYLNVHCLFIALLDIGIVFLFVCVLFNLSLGIMNLLGHYNEASDLMIKGIMPIYHLGNAIGNGNIHHLISFIAYMIIPFLIMIVILSYRLDKIIIRKPCIRKHLFNMNNMYRYPVFISLILREWKHYKDNAMVLLNTSVGVFVSYIVSILIMRYNYVIISYFKQLLFYDYIFHVFCIIGMLVGVMNLMSASSISIEGKNLWILKSLPIRGISIINAKLVFHLLISLPADLFYSYICINAFGFNNDERMLMIVIPLLFSIFVGLLGLLSDLMKPYFHWSNEVMCVKQGFSVLVTIFISMFMIFGICYCYIDYRSLMSVVDYLKNIIGLLFLICVTLYGLLIVWGTRRFKVL